MNAVLRRTGNLATSVPPSGPSWRFDTRQAAFVGPTGRTIWLARGSAEILKAFVANPGALLDRPALAQTFFGSYDAIETRAVDMRVTRLRRLLDGCEGGGRLIKTRRMFGYYLDAQVRRRTEDEYVLIPGP